MLLCLFLEGSARRCSSRSSTANLIDGCTTVRLLALIVVLSSWSRGNASDLARPCTVTPPLMGGTSQRQRWQPVEAPPSALLSADLAAGSRQLLGGSGGCPKQPCSHAKRSPLLAVCSSYGSRSVSTPLALESCRWRPMKPNLVLASAHSLCPRSRSFSRLTPQ